MTISDQRAHAKKPTTKPDGQRGPPACLVLPTGSGLGVAETSRLTFGNCNSLT